jgi:hypothetical protein
VPSLSVVDVRILKAGWDQDPYVDDGQGGHKLLLTGTPILFVPGNAGSYSPQGPFPMRVNSRPKPDKCRYDGDM